MESSVTTFFDCFFLSFFFFFFVVSKVFCHWVVENNHPFFCTSLSVIPLTWEFHFLIILYLASSEIMLLCMSIQCICLFFLFFFCSNQLASYSWIIVCKWWIRWFHDVLGSWVSTASTVVKQEINGIPGRGSGGSGSPPPPPWDLTLVWDWNSYMNDRIVYHFLVKSNYWSIINAAFWLVELLLGYML